MLYSAIMSTNFIFYFRIKDTEKKYINVMILINDQIFLYFIVHLNLPILRFL